MWLLVQLPFHNKDWGWPMELRCRWNNFVDLQISPQYQLQQTRKKTFNKYRRKHISRAAVTFLFTVRYLRRQQQQGTYVYNRWHRSVFPRSQDAFAQNQIQNTVRITSQQWCVEGTFSERRKRRRGLKILQERLRKREARGKPGASRNFPQVRGIFKLLKLWHRWNHKHG